MVYVCVVQKHQKLEDMKMSEDERQTTRLADAFKQDALRQNAFRKAMLSASSAEKQQQMIALARSHAKDTEFNERVTAQKKSLSFKKQASISQLKALEHALLRANPELEVLRPRGGDAVSGGISSGQTLAGHSMGSMQYSQDADKVPPTPCCPNISKYVVHLHFCAQTKCLYLCTRECVDRPISVSTLLCKYVVLPRMREYWRPLSPQMLPRPVESISEGGGSREQGAESREQRVGGGGVGG